jgi:hypothetical protein
MHVILNCLEKWPRLADDPVKSRRVTSKSCVTKFENNVGCSDSHTYSVYRIKHARRKNMVCDVYSWKYSSDLSTSQTKTRVMKVTQVH